MSKDYARQFDKEHHKILGDLARRPENAHCIDCGRREATWASANLGIFMCLRCSGFHRSLGVHISEVRSLTMDAWFPEQIETMKAMGNARGRGTWEAKLPTTFQAPDQNASDEEIGQWIRDKYERKKWHAGSSAAPKDIRPIAVPRQLSQKVRASPDPGRCAAFCPDVVRNLTVLWRCGAWSSLAGR